MNKNLSERDSNNNTNKDKAVLVSQSFSGPLPPPEILGRYEEVVPGSAERIIKMAEGQFSHRTELERKVIDSDIQITKNGQRFGFLIALAGLIVAAVVSIYGKQWAGSVIGGGTLATLVGVFVYGSRARNKERDQKNIDKDN